MVFWTLIHRTNKFSIHFKFFPIEFSINADCKHSKKKTTKKKKHTQKWLKEFESIDFAGFLNFLLKAWRLLSPEKISPGRTNSALGLTDIRISVVTLRHNLLYWLGSDFRKCVLCMSELLHLQHPANFHSTRHHFSLHLAILSDIFLQASTSSVLTYPCFTAEKSL